MDLPIFMNLSKLHIVFHQGHRIKQKLFRVLNVYLVQSLNQLFVADIWRSINITLQTILKTFDDWLSWIIFFYIVYFNRFYNIMNFGKKREQAEINNTIFLSLIKWQTIYDWVISNAKNSKHWQRKRRRKTQKTQT